MSEVSFDLDAGDICLDFCNTSNWHASAHPQESLHSYFDLVTWAQAADLISSKGAEELNRLAQQKPDTIDQPYKAAIQLREAIYHIFSSHYAGKPVAQADLTIVSDIVREAQAHRQLTPSRDGLKWEWDTGGGDPRLIAWKVGLAAADLLTSDTLARVRECEDDRGCGYLFIDMSKNHSRRWCSMESCGNRAKARRHYSRSKTERE